MTKEQSHIPKRATQHGLFLSSAETAPTSLKPGQQELHGIQVFKQEARQHRDTYINQDNVRDSCYTSSIAQATLPEDYSNPTKPYKPPDLVRHQLMLQKEKSRLDDSGTTHWESEYKATSQREPMVHHRPSPRRVPDPVNGVGRTRDESSYTQEFGRYGSDPRDRIPPGSTKLPVLRHHLNMGTTKGTFFVPGYQGFIPSCPTLTHEAARAADGAGFRNTDKSNIEHVYHANIVGYSGHCPESARNDRGGRQPTKLTTSGRDFAPPKCMAIALSAR